MPSKQFRASPFTLWYNFEQAIALAHDDTMFRYIIMAEEICPDTGRLHLQCFAQWKKKMTLAGVKKHFQDKSLHLETAWGNASQNQAYCKKGAGYAGVWKDHGIHHPTYGADLRLRVERGTPHDVERSDLEEARELIQQHISFNDVLNDPDLTDIVSRHMQWARSVFDAKPILQVEWPHPTFLPWQQDLLDTVAEEPHKRHIHWVYDPRGHSGKSDMTAHLVRNHGAISVAGKAENVFCAYDMQKIIIWDIPRDTKDDYINYGAIEKLKDGVFFSGKYNPVMKVRNYPAHVIVFSNHEPKPGAWSADRLQLHQISEPDETHIRAQFPMED